ncbi:MAG: pantoate--beta-alanine ligase [Bacteroidota bacterium]|nr:pantoate--beta-alanine ligase [Bacteroidota bacterium]
MKRIETIAELQKELSICKSQGLSVGLVPTMGSLHNGHITLVKRCAQENGVCVVSVFVNPTQFNDQNDLKTYPRTPEEDCSKLEKAGCNFVFMPAVEEMYPEPDTRQFNFGNLQTVMEGRFRPGHFNGVAQIVSKLLTTVKPDKAYFGEKDFQQLAIVREMVRQLRLPVTIVPCPIVRESDGLAMSSRNKRLSAAEREKAPLIAGLLSKSRTFASVKSVSETIEFVKKGLAEDPAFRVEYFEIVDGNTLQAVESWNSSDYIVGCIAVFCGPVRLIDNIVYKTC